MTVYRNPGSSPNTETKQHKRQGKTGMQPKETQESKRPKLICDKPSTSVKDSVNDSCKFCNNIDNNNKTLPVDQRSLKNDVNGAFNWIKLTSPTHDSESNTITLQRLNDFLSCAHTQPSVSYNDIDIHPSLSPDNSSIPTTFSLSSIDNIGVTALGNITLNSQTLSSEDNTFTVASNQNPKTSDKLIIESNQSSAIDIHPSLSSNYFSSFDNISTTLPSVEISPQNDSSESTTETKTRSLESIKEENELFLLLDKDGNSKLHRSIMEKDASVARQIIAKASSFEKVNYYNNLNQTPLHLAVLSGQADIVRKLMTAGGLVGAPDLDGNTPLHLACQSGRMDIVEHLVSHIQYKETLDNHYTLPFQRIPQDLKITNKEGKDCKTIAFENKHIDICKRLYNLEH